MTAPVQRNNAFHGSEPSPDLVLLWPLLGRHIAYHRRLVHLTQSVKAALLLSQAIYWTRHGRDIASNDGWFHKTAAQWALETGLTAKEQEGARQLLRDLGLLAEKRNGVPAVLHFRLEPARLVDLLAAHLRCTACDFDWANSKRLYELLGLPLAYHRILATIGGGVHAGLLLSRALYLTRYPARLLPGGWFYAPMKLWMDEIGLGRSEHQAARRELVRIGVWDEDVRGIPPRHFVRVRMQVLLALLSGKNVAATKCSQHLVMDEILDGGIPTIKEAENPPSSKRFCHNQDSTKSAIQIRQNQQSSFDKTCKLNVLSSTRCLVQTPLQVDGESNPTRYPSDGGGDELILPQKLLPGERAAAIILVGRCPQQAQALLDELHARLEKNAIRTSPNAYLRGLVERAIAGTFIPELAPSVAAARLRLQTEKLAREQRAAEARRAAAAQNTPELQAQAAERRKQVSQMLAAMRATHQRKTPT